MHFDKKPQWLDADSAIQKIAKGKRIFIGSGAASPPRLIQALVDNAKHFYDNEIVHLFILGEAPFVKPELQGNFRDNSFFIGANVRKAIAEGRGDYTPIFLSEIPRLFSSKQMPLHCALIHVSPPNQDNMVSLGVSVDVVRAAVENAQLVIAQVNPQMPYTVGNTQIPLSMIDYLVSHKQPIAELPLDEIDETSMRIGKHVSRLISDGDTLQLGIGNIPNAVLKYLKEKNDLGIHTEMFSDGVIELYRNGNITNQRKGIHQGVTITSFVFGSKDLYQLVDQNRDFEFHPSEYVNDPWVISQNQRMVSVNSAIQVDLTGQVCADSLGDRFFSGIGGQVDFVRGARRSPGGRSIIALPSTAKGGKISRIVPLLYEGAGVVTSRGDVQYVVTEYGWAYLHGKTIRERGLALAQIAHPNFREELLDHLKAKHYVHIDQTLPPHDDQPLRDLIPESKEFNGKTIYFRALRPCDERTLQDFFYSHDPDTIYHRYLYPKQNMPHEEAKNLVSIDYTKDMAVAGFESPEPFAPMVCVGRYIHQPDGSADKATIVREDYRYIGIGSFLCRFLMEAAKKQGVKRLVSCVSRDNTPMIQILKKHGFQIQEAAKPGVQEIVLSYEIES